MTHIAIILPTIDQIGGAERQALLLAMALSERGWRVTLIVLSGTGEGSIVQLRRAHVQLLCLGMRKAWIDPRGWIRYLVWARKERPDILHAHLPHAMAFARWVRILSPVRAVVDTIHTSGEPSRRKRFLYRSSDWLSDLTTCVSQAVAEVALRTRIVMPDKLRVVFNGVNLPSSTSEIQRTGIDFEPASNSLFQWIAVGRLAPVKDYPNLIRAFALLLDSGLRTDLRIAGSGPEEDSLRSLARDLGIDSAVQFAGFCPDIAPLLKRSDGFVLSSLWEGLPVSLLEAQAASLPVVATDVAGTREAMIPEVTGLLVPVGDAQALSEAMRSIMERTPQRRSEMGAAARTFVGQNFSLPVIVRQWEDLYASILSYRPLPRRSGYGLPCFDHPPEATPPKLNY